MYLQKAPNGVYQTRICIPKPLRAFGYPFDIKVSLLTKERSEAIERNFTIAHCIKSAISQIETSNPPTFSLFKVSLNKRIDTIRNNFKSVPKPIHPPTSELITFLKDARDLAERQRDSYLELGRAFELIASDSKLKVQLKSRLSRNEAMSKKTNEHSKIERALLRLKYSENQNVHTFEK